MNYTVSAIKTLIIYWYVLKGLLGWLLFSEEIKLKWCVGFVMILTGLLYLQASS